MKITPEMVREAEAHFPYALAEGPTKGPRWQWFADFYNHAMQNPGTPCPCCNVTPDGEIKNGLPQPPAEAQPVAAAPGDLLPCPFCGADSADTGGLLPWVECTDCDASGPSCGTEEEAVAAWNRRTPPPSAPVGVEGLSEDVIATAAWQSGFHLEKEDNEGEPTEEWWLPDSEGQNMFPDLVRFVRNIEALAKQPAAFNTAAAPPPTQGSVEQQPASDHSEHPLDMVQQPAADPLDRIRKSPEYAREMARHDAQELAADFVEAKPVGYVSRDASQAFMRVNLPEGTKLYTQQPADSGYQSAFYQTAAMLGIPAQPLTPREVWETQMRPLLLDLTSKQSAAMDGAMVERAARAWCDNTTHPFDELPDAGKTQCLEHMRAVLTAALAGQQGGA